MATRANVLIRGQNSYDPQILLYHHFDGYPEYMLPTMLQYKKILSKELKKVGGGPEWKKIRLGNPASLASLIIATDPTGFEIEAVFEKGEEVVLNGDIEYCYVITTSLKGIFIEIYTSHGLPEEDEDRFWKTGDPKLLKQVLPSTPFTEKELKKVLV